MLYPLSYERTNQQYTAVRALTVRADAACTGAQRRASDFLILNGLNLMVMSVFVAYVPSGRSLPGAQGGDGFDKAVTFELAEYVLYVLWRPGPRIGDLLYARGDGPPVDADLVQYEVIGRLGLDVPLPEVGCRKMLQIAGDDHLGTGLDRSCQHVPVGWIRELESFDEGFVPGDEAVLDRLVHQLTKAVKLFRRDVRPVPAQCSEHLVQDLVGPLGLHRRPG